MSGERRRLLLVGMGHAHLFVLEALAHSRLRGVDATLLTPAEYHYSGMVPGIVAGRYADDAARFDPAALCRAAGAHWVEGVAAAADPTANTVRTAAGAALGYDVVSFDVGSRTAACDAPGAAAHATPTKPVHHVLGFRDRALAAARAASAAAPAQLAIVGGQAAGVEVAFCLDALLARAAGRGRYRIRLLEAGEQILAAYPRRLRRLAERLLESRGVEIRTRTTAVAATAGSVIDADGRAWPAAASLWATGPRAPSLLRRCGLPLDAAGWLRVSQTLQSVARPEVFGAGDCVAIEGHGWVPRAGVYAVREGPVLARNLAAFLDGRLAERYLPQRDWLSLLNTGDGRALLAWRGASAHGRAAWWLKDRIDRRFMARFRGLRG